jgi:hypothetical protein
MSSDDFGTINAKRGERAREIEVLRQHYRQHRDALQRMTADAPTEHLASEYQRLTSEIERALGKLDELEGKAPASAPIAPPPPPPAARPHPAVPHPATMHNAGSRPLVHDAVSDAPAIPPATGEEGSRLPLIIAVSIIALAVIAGIAWWASRDGATGTVVEERPPVAASTSEDTVATVADDTIAAAGSAATELTATPASQDYGVIRKGTRAVRQFELTNTTDAPMSIQVARSACRCLYYDHAPVIPPKAKETLTVTVDGARAKAGELREQIKITSKADAAVATTVNVNATIR